MKQYAQISLTMKDLRESDPHITEEQLASIEDKLILAMMCAAWNVIDEEFNKKEEVHAVSNEESGDGSGDRAELTDSSSSPAESGECNDDNDKFGFDCVS